MDSISYDKAKSNLARTMKRVVDDREPVMITRADDTAVVMLSLEDYASLEESSYLLRSPKNARRLRAAVRQLDAGKGKRRKLAS